MPIVRTYGDPGIFGQGAYDAGRLQGQAARQAQQREIDARFTENRLTARERIAAIETANNYASARNTGGGGQDSSGRPENIFNDFAQERQAERDQNAIRTLEASKELQQRNDLLQSLDGAYDGREKDFTYQYAKNLIQKGEDLPERIQSALGITSQSEKTAKLKAEKAAKDGQIDDFEPKTDRERLARRSLEQGRAGDLIGRLDQRGKDDRGRAGVGPLTDDALAARTQLEGFASATSDMQALIDTRKSLQEGGASEETKAIIDERIEQLNTEQMELKAPAAFEQAVGTFQTRLTKAQADAGRTLNVTEKRKLLASTLTTTAEGFGLTVEQLGQYIRSNDENRRQAEQLISQAQEVIKQMLPPKDALTGSEQQFGPNDQARDTNKKPTQRRPDFGQRGAN